MTHTTSSQQFSRDDSMAQRASLVRWFFWGLVLIYAVALLWRPAFGIIDDHQFVSTISVGRFLPLWIVPSLGRYSPLLAQEYNLVSLISGTPFAFYTFNVVELFLAMWLFVRIGQAVPNAQKHPFVPYLTTACILVSPAFTISWFRLWVQEKNELVLLLAFLLTYLRFRSTTKRVYFVLCASFAFASLFTKETALVPVGTIAVLGLVKSFQGNLPLQGRKSWYALHITFLASCFSFLALYYLFAYRHRGAYLYSTPEKSVLMQHVYAIAGTFMRDPILILGLLALFFSTFVLRRSSTSATFRVLLLASLALVSAYIVLGLSNTYYMLPTYFTATYLVTAAFSDPEMRRLCSRPLPVVVFWVLLVNQTIVAAQQVTFWRVAAQDFQAVLPALEVELKGPIRTRLFVDGISPGSSGEVYKSLIANLSAAGLSDADYDLLANAPIDNKHNHLLDVHDSFSFRKATIAQIPQAGDLMLVIPGDPLESREKFEESTQYVRVAGSHSWAYQNLSLKSLCRRVLHQPAGVDAIIDPNYLLYKKR